MGRRLLAVIRFGLGVSLALLAYLCGELAHEFFANKSALTRKAETDTRADVARLKEAVRRIESMTHEMAEDLAALRGDEGAVRARIEQTFTPERIHYAAAVAYRPFAWDEKQRLFALHTGPVEGEITTRRLDHIYDYTAEEHGWYHEPFASGAGWSDTYWGEAGQAMMASYCVPILAPGADADSAEYVGVAVADFCFDEIYQELAKRDRGSYGYGFVLDATGTIIGHPNRELVLSRNNLLDYSKSYSARNRRRLHNAIENHEPVAYVERNSFTRQRSYFTLMPVPSTGWFVGNALVLDEVALPDAYIRRSSLRILTVLLFALLLWSSLGVLRAGPGDILGELGRASTRVSIAFGIGIGAIWFLQVYKGGQDIYTDGFIGSMEHIQRLEEREFEDAKRDRRTPPVFVPTGILVRSAKITGLNEATVYGIAWQRVANGADFDAVAGIRLPDATESKFEEDYRIQEDGHTVVGWSFSAVIRQSYDNQIYPFDRINLFLRMRTDDAFTSVVLVPDLKGYELVSPSAKAFVATNIVIPGWQVDKTYFTFREHAYNIDFGLRQKREDDYVRDLVLNIPLSRLWIGNMVSVLVPVFIILAFSYCCLQMICNGQDMRKLFNFDAMRMVVVGASFSLFLVIATQTLRSHVVSEGLIYVEQLYFIIYFVLLANVFIAIGVTKLGYWAFRFHHGAPFVKLYWPVITVLFFLVTLLNFY